MSPKVPAASAEVSTEEMPFLINSAKTNFSKVQENNQSLHHGMLYLQKKLSDRSVAKINKENRQIFGPFFVGGDREELGKR